MKPQQNLEKARQLFVSKKINQQAVTLIETPKSSSVLGYGSFHSFQKDDGLFVEP